MREKLQREKLRIREWGSDRKLREDKVSNLARRYWEKIRERVKKAR